MLTNSGPVAKLYLSIIDDVIESMRELFLEEGLEDRVLEDLRQLWEGKMLQSKAMDDFRKNNISSSSFVLQLPENYSQPRSADPELSTSVVIPANHSFPVKSSSEGVATFSLPAGLSYPVQIPAGVTLQTASGQLYKVNVPVVVTQGPLTTPSKSTLAPPPPQQREPEPPPTDRPPRKELGLQQQQQQQQQQPPPPPACEVPLGVQSEPVDLSSSSSSAVDVQQPTQTSTQTSTAPPTAPSARDIHDLLQEAIQEERNRAQRMERSYGYSDLSDIVQLDGPAENSDREGDEGLPVEENDFLGLINAEAMAALRDGAVSSSSSNSICSSDSLDAAAADPLADLEEEDPLNSGDDVIEQDIPDLFDTDNVIVCQYDKIHRSKNRWKFHLKDGVMSYSGKDYVFCKAVGEAEW